MEQFVLARRLTRRQKALVQKSLPSTVVEAREEIENRTEHLHDGKCLCYGK